MGRGWHCLSLIHNILFNSFPIPPLADRGDVKSITPEFTAPEVFFERRKSLEEFSCRDAFEDANNFRPAVFRRERYEDVDVIEICTDFFKSDVIAEGDFLRNLCDRERDIVLEQRFTIFDGKDNVVVGVIDVVTGMDDGHARSIQLETKGFQTFLWGTRGKPRGKRYAYFSY